MGSYTLISSCIPLSLLLALLVLRIPLLACSVPSAAPPQDPTSEILKENAILKEEDDDNDDDDDYDDDDDDDEDEEIGKRWAVLIAGTTGYEDYRHQADVCHAYQVLHKGGLADENIVVFMYDDIANNTMNPRPGTIINNPKGEDVYAGVPKDYTGEQVVLQNLYAVLLGAKNLLLGGSGKVLESGPDDYVFIYYSGHGTQKYLQMPPSSHDIKADDLNVLLQAMHQVRAYKEMIIYVEACKSGSMFAGLLPDDLKIYAMTASNPYEDCYATYCPRVKPYPPPGYNTCIADTFSATWMRHSESSDRMMQTVGDQYDEVDMLVSTRNTHVMEYGDMSIRDELLYKFQGFDPSFGSGNVLDYAPPRSSVAQSDVELLYLWQSHEHELLDVGSKEKAENRSGIVEAAQHQKLLDVQIEIIGQLIFGAEHGPSIIKYVRSCGQPVVDDWDCLSSMIRVFQSHCGLLIDYGVKQMRAFVNICNRGISKDTMEEACIAACKV